MIDVKNLYFDYPGVRALDNVSFSVKAGNITALVGPNGAGKTTLLRCLAGLEQPFSGSIQVENTDVLKEPRECHRKVGFLSDFFGLYEELTVEKCICYSALSHGHSPDGYLSAAKLAAERLNLSDRLNTKAGELSRGLRQKLAIAQAIVHEPKILLLDEPASGLDPEARADLAELFIRLSDQGITLIVSSHILAELDEYSTDMIILKNGKIISHEIIGQESESAVLLKLTLTKVVDSLHDVLTEVDHVTDIKIDGATACFSYVKDPFAQHLLLKDLILRDLPIMSFVQEKVDMQNAYLDTVKVKTEAGEGI